jgi:hypothetical protein
LAIRAIVHRRTWAVVLFAIRDEFLEFFKSLKKVFGFLAALSGALELIAIVEKMHPVVLGDFLSALAHAFRTAQDFVFLLASDFGIPQLLQYFEFNLSLPLFWRDILTILMLYNFAHIKESFSEKVKHKWRAFLIRLLGALGSVFVALWVSTVLSNWGSSQLTSIVISVAAGVVAYRVVFSFQF